MCHPLLQVTFPVVGTLQPVGQRATLEPCSPGQPCPCGSHVPRNSSVPRDSRVSQDSSVPQTAVSPGQPCPQGSHVPRTAVSCDSPVLGTGAAVPGWHPSRLILWVLFLTEPILCLGCVSGGPVPLPEAPHQRVERGHPSHSAHPSRCAIASAVFSVMKLFYCYIIICWV